MSTSLYWDGVSGAISHGASTTTTTTKPIIEGVTYDSLVYDTEEGTRSKTIGKQLFELTSEEISAVQLYAEKNASPLGTLDTLVQVHNRDSEAHHDIRVQLSNLHEFAHKVASVWSTEGAFSGTTVLPWKYCVFDITDFTLSTDETVWIAPANESYDVTIRLGTAKAVSGTYKIEFLKNGTEVLYSTQGTASSNVITASKVGVLLNAGDKLSVRFTAPSEVLLVSTRTSLIVDNHGKVLAKRSADYRQSAIGGIVSYQGTQMLIQTDDAGKPAVVADKYLDTETVLRG